MRNEEANDSTPPNNSSSKSAMSSDDEPTGDDESCEDEEEPQSADREPDADGGARGSSVRVRDDGAELQPVEDSDGESEQYDPEAEYLSDPDFHDERPGKRPARDDTNDSASPVTVRSLDGTSQDAGSLSEEAAASGRLDDDTESRQVVTASEANAEFFADEEVTLADEVQGLESTDKGSDDRTTPGAAEEPDAVVVGCGGGGRQDSLDDICSEIFDEQPACKSDSVMRLVGLVGDYCVELIGLIIDEALRRAIASERAMCDEAPAKKIYTSSMFFADEHDTFPTIEQQVQRCRSIADQLNREASAESAAKTEQSKSRRAGIMFRRRRDLAARFFTLEQRPATRRASLEPSVAAASEPSSKADHYELASAEEELASFTDTEYEAPRVRRRPLPTRATTTPWSRGARSERHVEVARQPVAVAAAAGSSKFGPFLGSSALKDIERLRKWSPQQEFSEHKSVSPEICLKLAQDLKSGPPGNIGNRGAQMFARRQLESCDWVVAGGEVEPTDERDQSSIGETLHVPESGRRELRSRPSLSEETVMVADETGERIVELAPAVMKHAQPKLELATVTRTPSFSASSWRVIERDSPELTLTSHDDADSNNDDLLLDTEQERAKPESPTWQRADSVQATMISGSRPPSRLHRSTLLHWRPQVGTPTWLMSDPPQVRDTPPPPPPRRCASSLLWLAQQDKPAAQYRSYRYPFAGRARRLGSEEPAAVARAESCGPEGKLLEEVYLQFHCCAWKWKSGSGC